MIDRLFLEKTKSSKGDTITEVLVALLISAIALTMLATMIMTSSKMITNSSDVMSGYLEKMNQPTAIPDDTFSSVSINEYDSPILTLEGYLSSFGEKVSGTGLKQDIVVDGTVVLAPDGTGIASYKYKTVATPTIP